MSTKSKTLPQIRVSPELYEAIEKKAASDNVTLSACIRSLLGRHFLAGHKIAVIPLVGRIRGDDTIEVWGDHRALAEAA